MNTLNRTTATVAKSYPNRIIQFGEGNFLRAFIDWMVYEMNNKVGFNAGVTVVQPIEQGMVSMLKEQDCLYHLIEKGLEKGEAVRRVQLIDVINNGVNPYTEYDAYMALADDLNNRFIISNTTEAGICFDATDKFEDKPAKSFPGKLTQLMYRRFQAVSGANDKGFIVMPCELIDRNGDNLLKAILQYVDLWSLGAEFKAWVESANHYCNTLVDRIVPGFPRETINEIKDEVGYNDNLVVEGEIFHLLVVEAPEIVKSEFPADKAGLNVLFVPSMKPYRDRKVTLLNGPHTVLSPVGYLSGLDTVAECVDHEVIGAYVRKAMYQELLASLDLPESELVEFSNDVIDRFRNPFVKHMVTSIMLNSFPKYKTRDLPAVKLYLERKGELPAALVLGLAAICVYYKGGKRGNDEIKPNDDAAIMELLNNLWSSNDVDVVAEGVLKASFIWGEDLTLVDGFEAKLSSYISSILDNGMMETVKSII